MRRVPRYVDWLGTCAERYPDLFRRIGRLESKFLSFDIAGHSIDKPVFITGLPRAGSTVLAEILNARADTTSFQYRDYPFPYCPFVWNKLRGAVPLPQRRVERTHNDGLSVNLQSPEAIDEMIWMCFFDHLHDSRYPSILDETASNPDFATFYRDNIKKLLMLRKAERFFTKNNANIARLSYIKTLFPDARFIITVRDPVAQVASMVKQDRLFREVQAHDSRSRRYTRRLGHFEFGRDFTPLNLGNTDSLATIRERYKQGQFACAYAQYWAYAYDFVADTLENDSALAEASTVVRYDRLCNDPATTIADIQTFCGLETDSNMQDWASHVAPPSYYTPDFDPATRNSIEAIVAPVCEKYAIRPFF